MRASLLAAMEVLFDTLLITQDSESVLFYAVAGLYNLSNDASFAQMAGRKPGVLAKLHSLAESANPDTVKYASGTATTGANTTSRGRRNREVVRRGGRWGDGQRSLLCVDAAGGASEKGVASVHVAV